jgi:hypothetical protein
MSNDKYIGLDVHQSSIVTAVHNHQGECVMESIIETFSRFGNRSAMKWETTGGVSPMM